MNRTTALLAAVTLCLGAAPLGAQTSLDTTFAVRGTAPVSVHNLAGTITVTSWNRAAVRIQAEYGDSRVLTDVSASRVAIRSEVGRGRRGDFEVEYTITVPAGTPLELSGTMSDVDVRGVCGPLSANVTTGDVTVVCAQGDVSVQSVAGDVDISDVRGGRVDVTATSGDTELHNVQGSVTVHSAAGDVTMSGIDSRDVSAETVAGEIAYSGAVHDNGRYRLEAHSGDVTMRTPGAFNATVSVSTFNGEFESDFPITITPGRQSTREWEFTLGSGSARVTLRSFSGTIELRRGAVTGGRSDREEEQP